MQETINLTINIEHLNAALENLDYFPYNELVELQEDVKELLKSKGSIEITSFQDQGTTGLHVVKALEVLDQRIQVEIQERKTENDETLPYLLEFHARITKDANAFSEYAKENPNNEKVLSNKAKTLMSSIEEFIQLYDLSDETSIIKSNPDLKSARKEIETLKNSLSKMLNINEFKSDLYHLDAESAKAKLNIQVRDFNKKAESIKIKEFDYNFINNETIKTLEFLVSEGAKIADAWTYICDAAGGLDHVNDEDLQALLWEAEKYTKLAEEILAKMRAESLAKAGLQEIVMDAPQLAQVKLDTEKHKNHFIKEIRSWANDSKIAILQVYEAVTDDSNDKDEAMITFDMVLDVLGLGDNPNEGGFSLAPYVSVAKIAIQFASNTIKACMPKNTVNFRELCESTSKGFEKMKAAKYDDMFKKFLEAFHDEHSEYTEDDFFKELRAFGNALDNTDRIKQNLMIKWIESAKDSWGDTDDWAGVIELKYSYHGGIWFLADGVADTAQIDDVENQKGTIRGMINAFGKNTPLYMIPLEIKISINSECKASRKSKSSGNTDFKYDGGDESLYKQFMKDKVWEKTGLVGDLKED
jgi:hypothetical protein